MKTYKNKIKISAVTFLLMLSFAFLATLPTISAHDPAWEIPTWSYISVSPSTVGVGQNVLLVFWLNDYPITAVGAYGDRWDNMYIDVTGPAGQETLGPFTSDPVGAGFAQYTPTEVGEYTFIFRFEGDTITGEPEPPGGFFGAGSAYIGDKYLPSQSDPVFLTVTEEPLPGYSETPLPEGYWTRPISGINRDWWKISGNWMRAGDIEGRFQKFSDGPGTSHIMWTKPYWNGGIMGGQFGSIGYYTGRSYEPFGTGTIILNGKFYYNIQYPPRYGWYCLDLRTGEELYFHNTTGEISYITEGFGFDFSGDIDDGDLAFGQIYNYESPNQHGGFAYLWSTHAPTPNTWMMFDSFTGNYICSIANVSASGTAVYGKDGSILRYNLDTQNDRLTIWNTSRAIWYEDFFPSNEYWMWRPDLGEVYDGNNGFSLNVSIPSDLTGSILEIVEGEYIIGGTAGSNDEEGLEEGTIWAISLAPGTEGTLLWSRTFVPPYDTAPNTTGGAFAYGHVAGPTVDVENAVFWFEEQLTRKLYVYDLGTMGMIWESDASPQWDFYGMSQSVAYGKLFNYGYGGVIDAYDILTGEKLWSYVSGTLGFETAYENTPLSLAAIADEKLYMYSTEHSPTMPLARGRGLRCIDVNTGEELWQIHHWGNDPALADGYLVDLNLYDNQFYCYGKGPSKTTVSAQPKTLDWGRSVIIEGTVTDESAGAKALVESGKFSSVAAVADEDMDEWMEYVYMQRPCPQNAVGVEVVLETLDPNGNFYEIGRATSDMSGFYSLMWEPPVPGKYLVYATFEGSEAYASSYGETSFAVEEQMSASQEMEPELETSVTSQSTSTAVSETPFITTETAIIAAVTVAAVIGLVSFWALRKRK
jgi:hypothetical protein